jgi:hypothetical protein
MYGNFGILTRVSPKCGFDKMISMGIPVFKKRKAYNEKSFKHENVTSRRGYIAISTVPEIIFGVTSCLFLSGTFHYFFRIGIQDSTHRRSAPATGSPKSCPQYPYCRIK